MAAKRAYSLQTLKRLHVVRVARVMRLKRQIKAIQMAWRKVMEAEKAVAIIDTPFRQDALVSAKNRLDQIIHKKNS